MAERRLRDCVERWPEAETGEYNPSCCRFPKSCSASIYSEEHTTEADLEPLPGDRDDPARHVLLSALASAADLGPVRDRPGALDHLVGSTLQALRDVPAAPAYGTPPAEQAPAAADPLPARAAALHAAARLVAANMQRTTPHGQFGIDPYAGGVGEATTRLAESLLRWLTPNETEDRRG